MKTCATCGREIEPRKKWAKNWDEIKYCSDRCRKNKVRDQFEEQLLAALQGLPRNTNLDPLQILSQTDRSNPEIVEKVRSAARRLHAKNVVVILQNRKPVDPSTARGPFEVRLA